MHIATPQLIMVNTFKSNINRETIPVPKYYYGGNCKAQTLYTRLRTHCSTLNMDLVSNKNIIDSLLSSCGALENASYFFSCPLYNAKRIFLPNNVSQYQPISLNLLLYGNAILPYATNYIIFRRYKSTYWILNYLHNNTAFSIYNTCEPQHVVSDNVAF